MKLTLPYLALPCLTLPYLCVPCAATAAGSEMKLGPTLVIVSDDRTASQARDVLTYGTQACINHAFRRYCYKRLDSLRQQRPRAAAGGGGGGARAGDNQRWWVERDKGIELGPAQIEQRLLATRALNGGWNQVPLAAGRKEGGGVAGVCEAAAVEAVEFGARGRGAPAAGFDSKLGDVVVVGDDEDVPVEGGVGGEVAGGLVQATGQVSSSEETCN